MATVANSRKQTGTDCGRLWQDACSRRSSNLRYVGAVLHHLAMIHVLHVGSLHQPRSLTLQTESLQINNFEMNNQMLTDRKLWPSSGSPLWHRCAVIFSCPGPRGAPRACAALWNLSVKQAVTWNKQAVTFTSQVETSHLWWQAQQLLGKHSCSFDVKLK
jgi:hypothetical protein